MAAYMIPMFYNTNIRSRLTGYCTRRTVKLALLPRMFATGSKI